LSRGHFTPKQHLRLRGRRLVLALRRRGLAVPVLLHLRLGSLAKRCGVCELDYTFADAGDGPAVFVILIIGFVVVGLALWMEVSYAPPLWLHFLLWIPLTVVLCLLALRLIKGVLIALQYRNKAAEGRIDRGE
jgi:uncharacterized protein (DUF983 family)